MNKANNRITIRLQSDLDGSLGVEHGKDFSLSMLISDHIDSHVEAFRSFLLAAAFPQTLVDKALTEEVVIPWGPHFELATALEKELAEAKALIAELQEANEMLGAGGNRTHVATTGKFDRVEFPDGSVGIVTLLGRKALLDADPLAMGDEIKPGRIMSDAAGEEAVSRLRESADLSRPLYYPLREGYPQRRILDPETLDLHAHDSLLEPAGFVATPKDLPQLTKKWEQPADFEMALPLPPSVPQEAIEADEALRPKPPTPVETAPRDADSAMYGADLVAEVTASLATSKPPTQILNVAGIEAGAFGKLGKANGVDGAVAARLNKLVNDPHFQQFAIEFTKTPYESVQDAVKFCVAFVQENAFRASFDKSEPIKFDQAQYVTMNELFADWAKEKGVTLE